MRNIVKDIWKTYRLISPIAAYCLFHTWPWENSGSQGASVTFSLTKNSTATCKSSYDD